MEDYPLTAKDFGDDFVWGVSTSAFQIEGAHDADGKGRSKWDVFTTLKGKIANAHHAQTACDFYNRYEEDIALLKQLNIRNFRFSIAWSRVLPEGTGEVNQKGIDYYNRLIDACLANGITPWVTLYHWDLPHALELKGGWTNRDMVGWFSEYSKLCAKHFGDCVKHWMVLNEPMVFTGAGYFLGVHAPGKKGLRNFLPALHHAVLCQAAGLRILKEHSDDALVGTTFSCSYVTSSTTKAKDVQAAQRVDALLNRMFIEPLLGLGYPVDTFPLLKRLDKYIKDDDKKAMVADFDFIGIQNYTREVVQHSWLMPYLNAKLIPADKRNVQRTVMNWEVYPEAIYKVIKQFSSYKQVKKIIVTENGAAFEDKIENGLVDDKQRIQFLQSYLQQILRAKQEGCPVDGYFVWSFLDNFEWSEGYTPRFGLVHVDYETQKRTVKQSGQWYSNFLIGKECREC